MLAHCNLKQIRGCVQNNIAFFLLCIALWWRIERCGGPLNNLLLFCSTYAFKFVLASQTAVLPNFDWSKM